MIPEIGHFALILAFGVALIQAVLPLLGAARGDRALIALAPRAAALQFILIASAFAALIACYVGSDFSVLNVASNSHTDKPLLYKITGVWGNHEGSMLLWVLTLSLYGFGVSFWGARMPADFRARALAIQGMIAAAFLAFILFTSNPFLRLYPAPLNGQGLNPILQDPGLAFHPPCLYLGYVGFSMTFSFAIAALIEGKVDAAWAARTRPWAQISWCFLTLGIAMGSWWSYYTLGWGGFWYWDPVENASFMPWLAGTALLHSLIVTEKREALKAWTILLAIITFSLSLLGTFLVRSGILTSVHSFASDPRRGVFILVLLTLTTGGAFIFYAFRAPHLKVAATFEPTSREGALLFNNLFLIVAAATVFLGTLYPLAMDALGLGRISVGPPYFNRTFLPLMVPLILAMALGPLLPWKQGKLKNAFVRLKLAFLAAIAVGLIAWFIAGGSDETLIAAGAFGIAVWLIGGCLTEISIRISLFEIPFVESWRRALNLSRAAYGMTVAHLGIAILIIGVSGATAWKVEKIQTMRPNDSVELAGYRVTLKNVTDKVPGPNYTAMRADFVVTKGSAFIAEMHPEKRLYTMPPIPTTDAAIHTNFLSDIYVVLGNPDGKGGYITRLYYNPFAPWIFIGPVIMALGGVLSLSSRLSQKARR